MAASALAAARELRPAVVLLDIQLPDLDGFEVALRLTSDGEPPAVVLTSSHDGSDFAGMIARQRRARLPPQGGAVRSRARRDPGELSKLARVTGRPR